MSPNAPDNAVIVTVDVGNSETVIGVFRDDRIVEQWRLTTRAKATSDEVFLRISGLIAHSSVTVEDVTHIGLSTVVPLLERTWVKALVSLFHIPVQVVSHHNCLGLPIDYANPQQLGPDRICNALAMKMEGLDNGIAVDMGTATTFDVLRDGRFAGGLIMPGINASLEVLTDKTARILPVTLHWPDRYIADNTDDAVRGGLLFGFFAKLEAFVAAIRKESGLKPDQMPVIATGGWSRLLTDRTDSLTTFDPHLTLKGVRAVALAGKEEST